MNKTRTRTASSVVLLVSASLAIAQQSPGEMGHTGSIFLHRTPQQTKFADATKDEGKAIAACMAARNNIREIIGNMEHTGSSRGRGQISYDGSDLRELARIQKQLEAALSELAMAHQRLVNELTSAQTRMVDKRLRRLARLRTKLDSEMVQTDHDLTRAKPGPGSPEIRSDLRAIESAPASGLPSSRRSQKS